jgi:thiol-disulfide isomerase/thioredoxin
MKKWMMLMLAAATFQFTLAQNSKEKPLHEQYPLPQFSLLLKDSATYFTKNNLPANTATIIILFNPDCEHCKHETELILANMDKFKNVHFVMATYQPLDKMKEFIATFQLDSHPSITVGRDTRYFFGGYFKNIRAVPYMAIYDKKGRFKKTFEGGAAVKDLLEALE